jgi:hypothetical protein
LILGGDDLIGVDVVPDDVDLAVNGFHLCLSAYMNSLGSVILPVMAEAATVSGDAR